MAKDGYTRFSEITDLATPSQAPMMIRFPPAMALMFQTFRRTSNPGGKPMERGGTIVADKDGRLSIQNVGGYGATATSFTPNFLIADRAKFRLAGLIHTHPADPSTGSVNGKSLSGADFALMLEWRLAIMVVQSGPRLFAAVRTKQSPLNVDYKKMTNAQNEEVYQQVAANGRTPAQATRIEAQELSAELRVAYYQGRDGVVARVDG